MLLVGGWVFSGISRFPRPLHSGAAPYSPQLLSSAANTSLSGAAQFSSFAWFLLVLAENQFNVRTKFPVESTLASPNLLSSWFQLCSLCREQSLATSNAVTRRLVVRSQRDRPTSSLVHGCHGHVAFRSGHVLSHRKWLCVALARQSVGELTAGSDAIQRHALLATLKGYFVENQARMPPNKLASHTTQVDLNEKIAHLRCVAECLKCRLPRGTVKRKEHTLQTMPLSALAMHTHCDENTARQFRALRLASMAHLVRVTVQKVWRIRCETGYDTNNITLLFSCTNGLKAGVTIERRDAARRVRRSPPATSAIYVFTIEGCCDASLRRHRPVFFSFPSSPDADDGGGDHLLLHSHWLKLDAPRYWETRLRRTPSASSLLHASRAVFPPSIPVLKPARGCHYRGKVVPTANYECFRWKHWRPVGSARFPCAPVTRPFVVAYNFPDDAAPAVAEISARSPPTDANRVSIPGLVGIVPDDAAAGRRVFSGISPPPPARLHSNVIPDPRCREPPKSLSILYMQRVKTLSAASARGRCERVSQSALLSSCTTYTLAISVRETNFGPNVQFKTLRKLLRGNAFVGWYIRFQTKPRALNGGSDTRCRNVKHLSSNEFVESDPIDRTECGTRHSGCTTSFPLYSSLEYSLKLCRINRMQVIVYTIFDESVRDNYRLVLISRRYETHSLQLYEAFRTKCGPVAALVCAWFKFNLHTSIKKPIREQGAGAVVPTTAILDYYITILYYIIIATWYHVAILDYIIAAILDYATVSFLKAHTSFMMSCTVSPSFQSNISTGTGESCESIVYSLQGIGIFTPRSGIFYSHWRQPIIRVHQCIIIIDCSRLFFGSRISEFSPTIRLYNSFIASSPSEPCPHSSDISSDLMSVAEVRLYLYASLRNCQSYTSARISPLHRLHSRLGRVVFAPVSSDRELYVAGGAGRNRCLVGGDLLIVKVAGPVVEGPRRRRGTARARTESTCCPRQKIARQAGRVDTEMSFASPGAVRDVALYEVEEYPGSRTSAGLQKNRVTCCCPAVWRWTHLALPFPLADMLVALPPPHPVNNGQLPSGCCTARWLACVTSPLPCWRFRRAWRRLMNVLVRLAGALVLLDASRRPPGRVRKRSLVWTTDGDCGTTAMACGEVLQGKLVLAHYCTFSVHAAGATLRRMSASHRADTLMQLAVSRPPAPGLVPWCGPKLPLSGAKEREKKRESPSRAAGTPVGLGRIGNGLSTRFYEIVRRNKCPKCFRIEAPACVAACVKCVQDIRIIRRRRIKKMEVAYHLTKDVYSKRSVSFNAKLRHCCTVIRPEALYAAECLAMNKKGLMEQLEAKERKILRKILGPVKENENNGYHSEMRIAFYGHLMRMSSEILSNQIFTYFLNKKTKGVWFTEVGKDLQELGISHDDIYERDPLKKKFQGCQGLQPKPKMKIGKVWTEERREAHRKRMQENWTNVKGRRKQLK
ncbi:hypothetical protein PR048_029385 [Dryococelus australis]|uniref:Uncharacterized protein n=1 Tax=Dryococelus australis TaxID=614101 RepID=A0ABQ9GD69_9NEOP|nr:hypothetical protein PR048_029385 [Dryococelus australis]